VRLGEEEGHKDEVIKQLESEGHKVYNTSSDGFHLRSVSYVDGFLELRGQLQERGIQPDAVYMCAGVHTHVGIAVGARALGIPLRVVGVSPSPQDNAQKAVHLAEVANEVARILDLDLEFAAGDFECYGEYAGPGYGMVTPQGREAVMLAAKNEGLVLEPIYSGKAFAGLIDHIRKGQYTRDQSVVFVHTGGTPALFAYADEIL
jgi:1-aminocyclopropane-1-carboxylate deaminase/D-cysteine desulfhydrase-like pyridoxal-dependent ACC family enzyme